MFFDIDEASDKKTDLPNMLPSPEEFAEYVGKVRMMAHCVPWSQECAHTNLTGCSSECAIHTHLTGCSSSVWAYIPTSQGVNHQCGHTYPPHRVFIISVGIHTHLTGCSSSVWAYIPTSQGVHQCGHTYPPHIISVGIHTHLTGCSSSVWAYIPTSQGVHHQCGHTYPPHRVKV